MATKSLKKKNIPEGIESEETEQTNIVSIEDYEDEVFDMLAGYTDKDGVTHKEFTLREMTGKDEEAIHKGDIKSNPSKVISVLLSRCVTRIGSLTPKSVGGIKNWENIIKDLYVGDQDYMLIQLRKISVGEEIEVSHTCPQCKAKLNTTVEVDELDIKPFKGEHEVPFELPRGYRDKKGNVHKTGTIRLAKGIDREILNPLAKNNIARAETVMLTRLCKFDDGYVVDEDIIGNLSIRDREYLQGIVQDNLFGVNLEAEVECAQCGEYFRGSLNVSNFM